MEWELFGREHEGPLTLLCIVSLRLLVLCVTLLLPLCACCNSSSGGGGSSGGGSDAPIESTSASGTKKQA